MNTFKAINDLIGKDVRLGLRRLVKLEVKTDKHELRILVKDLILNYLMFLILL